MARRIRDVRYLTNDGRVLFATQDGRNYQLVGQTMSRADLSDLADALNQLLATAPATETPVADDVPPR